MGEPLAPERNRDNDLKADQLRAGRVEQYAIMRGGRQHAVTLGWKDNEVGLPKFYVYYTVTHHSGVQLESRYQTYITVNDARVRFREYIRTIRK